MHIWLYQLKKLIIFEPSKNEMLSALRYNIVKYKYTRIESGIFLSKIIILVLNVKVTFFTSLLFKLVIQKEEILQSLKQLCLLLKIEKIEIIAKKFIA